MPEGEVLRYKKVKCRTCGKIIKTFDREKYTGWHVTPEDIMEAIRYHYKKYHPGKFREWYR